MLFGCSLWGGLFSSADCAVVATGLNRQCLTCLAGPGWPWGSVNIYSVWPWLCRPPVKHDSCSVCSPSTTLCPLTKRCKGTEMSQGWKLLQTSSHQFGIRELQQSGIWNSIINVLKPSDEPFTVSLFSDESKKGLASLLNAPGVFGGLCLHGRPASYLQPVDGEQRGINLEVCTSAQRGWWVITCCALLHQWDIVSGV